MMAFTMLGHIQSKNKDAKSAVSILKVQLVSGMAVTASIGLKYKSLPLFYLSRQKFFHLHLGRFLKNTFF